MASTPFFFLSGLLFLAWFTADVHSVKVIDVLKGSSVVLRPVEAVTSITTITWKHGDNLAAEWLGGNLFFYNIFNNGCSLNTETGQLTINNVRPEHSGVYTPDINEKTRSAMKLRVLSPVPKPTISHDCVPGETLTCTLTCKFDRTDDLGHVEVFWILDNRRVKGPELQITKDTKTETFICSLKNSVSSENSTKLLNPFLPVKVIDVLKGSSVVLRPVEAVTSITTITWKHGDNLAAEWLGGDLFFYNIFNNTSSLNTETGQLTINNVRPEHSGVYTPDINEKTRSALELRVLYPVPKPSISHDCYPGETPNCTIRCMHAYTPENVGHMEVFWILDNRRVKGPELQITEDTKTETFVCSLKNSVSSENSTKLLNPFLPGGTGVPVWKPVVITLASLVSVVLLVFLCRWIHLKHRLWRIIKEIRETMPLTEHDRNSAETPAAGSVTEHDRIFTEIKDAGLVPDVEIKLLDADKEILRTLNEGNETNLSEDSILKLLTARYLILRTLQQGSAVQESLEKVKKIIKKFFRGRNDLWLYKYEKQTFQDVQRILRILNKRNELKLPRVFTDEEMTLLKFRKILNKRNYLQLSEDEKEILQDVCEKISTLIKREEETVVRDEQSPPNALVWMWHQGEKSEHTGIKPPSEAEVHSRMKNR
ncbi:uncharacterized protein LOC144989702 isoform X3 [Oryzias latipes]